MNTVVRSLAGLAERLQKERRQALDELLCVSDSAVLPHDLLAKVGHLQSACAAVQAEIAAHTPKVGSGAES